jgi:predicted permease
MLSQLLHVVAPVFGVAAVGWLAAGFRRLDLGTITDVVIYLAAPALVFHSLASRPLDAVSMLAVGGGAIAQILLCGAVAVLAFQVLKVKGRGPYLAAMFPNTGNLGLPLALFAFGPEGLTAGVIVFSAVTAVHYSLGLMIVSGSPHPGEALRMPLLHAAVLGVASALSGVTPPEPVMKGLELLGGATVPLMLLSLGVRMRSVKLRRLGLPLLLVALRFAPGLAAAVAWTSVVGLEGPERGVLLVTGVLPSAVMNFVLAEVYDQQAEEVASAILIGTLLTMLAVPLVLTFLV